MQFDGLLIPDSTIAFSFARGVDRCSMPEKPPRPTSNRAG